MARDGKPTAENDMTYTLTNTGKREIAFDARALRARHTIANAFNRCYVIRSKATKNGNGVPEITITSPHDEWRFLIEKTNRGYSVRAFINGAASYQADGFYPGDAQLISMCCKAGAADISDWNWLIAEAA